MTFSAATLRELAERLSRPAPPVDLPEDWSFIVDQVASTSPGDAAAVESWFRDRGAEDPAALARAWQRTVDERAAHDTAAWLRDHDPPALAAIADQHLEDLPSWVAERFHPLTATRLRITLPGPLPADPLRSWLARLPLATGGRTLYQVAERLAAGRPVRAWLTPSGVAITFVPGVHALDVVVDAPVGDDEWWATVLTEAGRMLRATTTELPDRQWISAAAIPDFEPEIATATERERQWDGALLIRR